MDLINFEKFKLFAVNMPIMPSYRLLV